VEALINLFNTVLSDHIIKITPKCLCLYFILFGRAKPYDVAKLLYRHYYTNDFMWRCPFINRDIYNFHPPWLMPAIS
jgi:hypothetical protein